MREVSPEPGDRVVGGIQVMPERSEPLRPPLQHRFEVRGLVAGSSRLGQGEYVLGGDLVGAGAGFAGQQVLGKGDGGAAVGEAPVADTLAGEMVALGSPGGVAIRIARTHGGREACGRHAEAQSLAFEAAVQPRLRDLGPTDAAMRGLLIRSAAYSAARSGDRDGVRELNREVAAIAARLGAESQRPLNCASMQERSARLPSSSTVSPPRTMPATLLLLCSRPGIAALCRHPLPAAAR